MVMLIFLSGPDDYRRIQKKHDLIAEFRKRHSELGLGFFDLGATGAAAKEWRDAFEEFSRSQSLFESAKLAVFENAFAELEAPALAKLLEPFAGGSGKAAGDKGASDNITILLSERDKPVKALAFLLEKPTISQKFENLEGEELLGFIRTEAKRLELKLSLPAAQFLATVYAGNSWALATELQKLAGWKPRGANDAAGTGTADASASGTTAKMIEKKDLDTFDLEAAPNYWMLLNGLKSYDMRSRLSTLERLLAMNDAPAKIFNILASQWREKTPQMAEFDFAVKSGKLEYEEALVDLVLG
jgi:DNA polymerase III delta subunit